jgi:hypothetical protein
VLSDADELSIGGNWVTVVQYMNSITSLLNISAANINHNLTVLYFEFISLQRFFGELYV